MTENEMRALCERCWAEEGATDEERKEEMRALTGRETTLDGLTGDEMRALLERMGVFPGKLK